MANSLTKLIQQRIILILVVVGLVLIIVARTFHWNFFKVPVDHVVAEVGALFLIIGTLHWIFENSLRKEMLRDIFTTALESSRIHDSGLIDCLLDSKNVSEVNHWTASDRLFVGVHSSSWFVDIYHDVLKERCAKSKLTEVYLVKPGSVAANYLMSSGSVIGDVGVGIDRIKQLVSDFGPSDQLQIYYHERVLRYSFIFAEHFIWVKFLSNSKYRTTVPALKVEAGTPLFRFFEEDIQLLRKECKDLSNQESKERDS